MSNSLVVRRIVDNDRPAMKEFLKEHWGESRLVTSYSEHEGSCLPGFIVYQDGYIVGLLTYNIIDEACELASINSTMTGRGIGSMMLRSLEDEATQAGCQRIWAITTNDNLQALRFYQKRGYRMKAVFENSIEGLRERKPSIPLISEEGIPLLSEIEVEKRLDPK